MALQVESWQRDLVESVSRLTASYQYLGTVYIGLCVVRLSQRASYASNSLCCILLALLGRSPEIDDVMELLRSPDVQRV